MGQQPTSQQPQSPSASQTSPSEGDMAYNNQHAGTNSTYTQFRDAVNTSLIRSLAISGDISAENLAPLAGLVTMLRSG